MGSPDIFQLKEILRPNFFTDLEKFSTKPFYAPPKIYDQTIFPTNNFSDQQFFRPTIFSDQQLFPSKNFYGPTTFWDHIFFPTKKLF